MVTGQQCVVDQDCAAIIKFCRIGIRECVNGTFVCVVFHQLYCSRKC